MNDFINIRDWPLVGLHMPQRVPDEQADTLMAQLEALYARAEPHVLLMDGPQQPRQSARFMATYARWSRESFDLQQRYCLGAVRIAEDEVLRRQTTRKADAWNASGQAPYPYRIFATRDEARAQALAWIAEPPARTVPTAPEQAR